MGLLPMIKARELNIKVSSLKEVKSFVEKNHYSHSVNGVKITYCFSVNYNEMLVGAVIFGQLSTTAWKKFSNKEEHVLELRRLVLIDDAGKNSESRVIGHCLKWLKKNCPQIHVVVSYADPNYGHEGVIYKASNFKYIGLSGKDHGFYDPETGKTYHSRALRTKYKGDYKPFVKKLRQKLANGELRKVNLQGKHCYVYILKPEHHGIGGDDE